MIAIGEYADTLRALGRFLDSVGACEVGIVERGPQIFVSWSGYGPMRFERTLDANQLKALQSGARLYRGLGGRS